MNLLRNALDKTTLWILSLPLALLLLTGLTGNAEARQRNNLAYASVAALKSRLENTTGFRIDDMRVTDAGAACIRFHTRDRVGAVSRAQAVVVGRTVANSNERDGRFEKEWDWNCLGLAYDVTGAVAHFF
jgi:hypothetical protein